MTPRGGARPNSGRKTRSDEPANNLVTIRFTEQEWATLKDKAAAQGLTVSEYIRRLVLS